MIEDFDRDLFKKCMPYLDKPPVIFDIGAHEGHYTKFVLEMIPDADCYLFEPNETLYHTLCGYKKVFLLAVCDKNGQQTFYSCPKANDELSSLYKREVFGQTGCEESVVYTTSLDIFCSDNGIKEIDYVKVDVEGAELDVLSGCLLSMSDKKIKFLQIEYGGTYKDAGIKFIQIIWRANLFGYRVYELIENTFSEVTEDNFIEDYRYSVFLLTYIPCS